MERFKMNYVLVPLMQDIIAQMAVDLVRVLAGIIVSLVLSAGALYSGMGLLDRLTAGIDEWKEIRKGNAAVALLYGAVMCSMLLLIGPRIAEFVYLIQQDLTQPLTTLQLAIFLLFLLLNYLLSVLGAIILVYLTINLVDRITPDLEELAELKKGNMAVAIILAVALVLIVLAAAQPMEALFTMIKSVELSFI